MVFFLAVLVVERSLAVAIMFAAKFVIQALVESAI